MLGGGGDPPCHTDPFLNTHLGSLIRSLAPKGKRDESQRAQVADGTFRDKNNEQQLNKMKITNPNADTYVESERQYTLT